MQWIDSCTSYTMYTWAIDQSQELDTIVFEGNHSPHSLRSTSPTCISFLSFTHNLSTLLDMLQKPRKDNRGPEVRIVIISFLAVSWVTVLARCWVRIKMIKAFALDDWLTVFTLQLFTVYSSFVLIGAHWGCGRRHHDLTVKQRVNAMHVSYFGFANESTANSENRHGTLAKYFTF